MVATRNQIRTFYFCCFGKHSITLLWQESYRFIQIFQTIQKWMCSIIYIIENIHVVLFYLLFESSRYNINAKIV